MDVVAYSTGSDPTEIGDFGFKVKVTVTENVSKMMKKIAKNLTINIFENESYCLIEHFIAVILIPNMAILYNKYSKKSQLKNEK